MQNAVARALCLVFAIYAVVGACRAQTESANPAPYLQLYGTSILTPLVQESPPSSESARRRHAMLVQPGKHSAFFKQGFQHLDVITDIISQDGSRRLSDLGPLQAPQVVRLLTGLPEGTELTIEFFRQRSSGQTHTRRFRIPPMTPGDFPVLRQVYAESYFFGGALLAALTAEVAHFHGKFPLNAGLLVAGIYPEGVLFKAGARRGDVLVAADPANGAAPCMFPELLSFLSCLDAFASQGPLNFTFVRGTTHGFHALASVPPYVLADVRQALQQRSAPAPPERLPIAPAIESITLEPQPVAPGHPFAVRVRFHSHAGPGPSGTGSTLKLRILAGNQVLFEEKPVSIAPNSGMRLEHTFRMKATATPGAFVVEVSLEGSSYRDTQSVALRIE